MTKFRNSAAVLLAAAPALSGCSWIFLERPPQQIQPGAPVNCTASRAAPVADTVGAVLYAATAIAALAAPTSRPEQSTLTRLDFSLSPGNKALLGGFSAGLSALFAVSAAQGYASTASCRALRNEPPERSEWPEPWLPDTAR